MKAKEKDAYLNLGHAIIFQAVRDYRLARNKYLRNRKYETKDEMDRIEKFFHSRLFGTITTIDPDDLIRRLRDE